MNGTRTVGVRNPNCWCLISQLLHRLYEWWNTGVRWNIRVRLNSVVRWNTVVRLNSVVRLNTVVRLNNVVQLNRGVRWNTRVRRNRHPPLDKWMPITSSNNIRNQSVEVSWNLFEWCIYFVKMTCCCLLIIKDFGRKESGKKCITRRNRKHHKWATFASVIRNAFFFFLIFKCILSSLQECSECQNKTHKQKYRSSKNVSALENRLLKSGHYGWRRYPNGVSRKAARKANKRHPPPELFLKNTRFSVV